MRETLQLLYRYNSWATERMLAALDQLESEQYNAPGCSGHGSIRDTIAHLLSTQTGWVSWLDGSKSIADAYRRHFSGDDIPTVAAARERWTPVARQTDAFVESLTDERLLNRVTWTLPNGSTGGAPLWHLVLHLANHGTHTRAQIVAAIRRAGHNPGSVELLHFALGEAAADR